MKTRKLWDIARRRSLAWAGLVLLVLASTACGQAEKIQVSKTAYKGWKNALRIQNRDVELIVTLDVGPRVLSYRRRDGKNVFKEYEEQLGKSGEKTWQIRGGHRLWTAPEDTTRTYFPDNGPVSYKRLGPGQVRITAPIEKQYGIQKELDLQLDATGSKVHVTHRISNTGKKQTLLAPWALSVMAPGGLEIIPLPANRPHPGSAENATSAADFAPHLNLTFWSYFKFTDERVKFGEKYITLRQDRKAKGPIKFGLLHLLGWVAYLNDGTLFVKHIPSQKNQVYPDRGVNYETFTNADMLEMESLGPLTALNPGDSTTHTETWELFTDVPAVRSEADIDTHVLPKVKQMRLSK